MLNMLNIILQSPSTILLLKRKGATPKNKTCLDKKTWHLPSEILTPAWRLVLCKTTRFYFITWWWQQVVFCGVSKFAGELFAGEYLALRNLASCVHAILRGVWLPPCAYLKESRKTISLWPKCNYRGFSSKWIFFAQVDHLFSTNSFSKQVINPADFFTL